MTLPKISNFILKLQTHTKSREVRKVKEKKVIEPFAIKY